MHENLTSFPDSVIQSPRWWVALSGGADSVALLYALVAYRNTATAPPIEAIHVNHGLHPDAAAWSDLCQRHADALNVQLHIRVCDVESSGRGVEADARRERYQAFESVLGDGDILFTAHHADDMVETVLLRLFRGAGPRGLSGIPRERACGRGLLFRPFLNTPAATLKAEVEAAGLEYVTDPSNLEVQQDRNYLRRVVLPALAERWPGYRETIQRAANLQAMAQQRLSSLPLAREETVLGEPALVVDPTADPAVLAAHIHQWLGESDTDAPDQRRLMELARQALTAGPGRIPELVCDGVCLRVWNGWIVRVNEPGPHTALPDELVVGESVEGPWGQLCWESATQGPALLSGTRVNCIASGDLEVLTPLNRPQKPIKKCLQEMRIPPWWRRHLPVLNIENNPVWLLPVGPLAGLATPDHALVETGLTPVWRVSASV